MKENAMLSLIAETALNNRASGNGNIQSALLIREIVINLSETSKKAQSMGDEEIHYLTSIALEAAREKLFLQMYENESR
jgi:hypothetical protein